MILRQFRLQLFFLVGSMLLIMACKKDEALTPDDHRPPSAGQNFVAAFTENGDENVVDSMDLDVLCFKMHYPISVDFPDGTQQSFDSDTALYGAIDDWYGSNPDSDADPALVFPIQVVLEDGTTIEVINDEQLCDLFFECYGAWEDEEAWEDFEEEAWEDECDEFEFSECFEVQFPIMIKIGDTVLTFESWDEADTVVYELIDDLDEGEGLDAEIVFPVSVILEDGQTRVLNSEDDFEALEDECHDDEACFELIFPITLNFPDGTNQEVNSEEGLEAAIDAWEKANPEGDHEQIVPSFPFNVLSMDSLTIAVRNIEELEQLEEACDDEEDDDD